MNNSLFGEVQALVELYNELFQRYNSIRLEFSRADRRKLRRALELNLPKDIEFLKESARRGTDPLMFNLQIAQPLHDLENSEEILNRYLFFLNLRNSEKSL